MEVSNHQWIINQIQAADSTKALEAVLIDIKSDQFEREPWSQDERLTNQIRLAYAAKSKSLRTKETDGTQP